MGIINLLIASVLHFGIILLDIAMALCIVRVLCIHFDNKLLNAFNEMGKPLVERIIHCTREVARKAAGRDIRSRNALAIGMLALLALRWIVVAFFNSVFT